MSKTKTKRNVLTTIILVIVTVALSVLVSSLVARNTTAFEESDTPLGVNKNNLIHTLEEYETEAGNTGKGITWKINSTGSITANGTYSVDKTDDLVFVLGTVEIDKEDVYTLSGAPNGSFDTYYIEARYTDANGNAKVIYSDFNGQNTTESVLVEGTQVTVRIIVKPGVKFNSFVFKPTLVAGEDSGKF